MKCAGLDARAMAARSMPPSPLSLLGLLRHVGNVERGWFRCVLEGHDVPRCYGPGDGDFTGAVADPVVVEEAWTRWRAEVAHSDAFVARAPDLAVSGLEQRRGLMSLRWVLGHLIEEYARHNGHADLLRERIDGATGRQKGLEAVGRRGRPMSTRTSVLSAIWSAEPADGAARNVGSSMAARHAAANRSDLGTSNGRPKWGRTVSSTGSVRPAAL